MLWQPFWKWRPVEFFQCRESIRDIIIYPHIKFWWYRTMLNLCGIVTAILKMATGRNFSMSNQFGTSLSTHISNFDDIGQCWIFAVLWQPFWKWRPVEIFQCRESVLQKYPSPPYIVMNWQNELRQFTYSSATSLPLSPGLKDSSVNKLQPY